MRISLRRLRGCHFVPKKENPLPLRKLRNSSILVSSDSSSIFLRVGVLLVEGVARGVVPVGDAVTLLLMLRVIWLFDALEFSLKKELLGPVPQSLINDPRGFV